MKTAVVVAGAAATAAVVVVYFYKRKKPAEVPAAVAPPADAASDKAGALAPVTVAPAVTKPPPAPEQPPTPKLGGALATIATGITVNNAVGDLVERVAGEGKGDVTRILGPVAGVGFVADTLVKTAIAKVGVPEPVAKHIAQTAIATAVVGVPAITLKLGAEGISKTIGLIAGKKAEATVRGAVSQLDPTKPGSIVNKAVVKPAATVVKGVGKALGKIF